VNIRIATLADVPGLLALERECATAAHWTEHQYQKIFESSENVRSERLALVAEERRTENSEASDRILIGFLVAQRVHSEWELENIVVSPALRRKNIGTRLLAELINRARQTNTATVFLEVRESNQAARAFYANLGFRETGRRRRYYADPTEDAVLYRYGRTKFPNKACTSFRH
jgi:ribosomal-protein-alanine acetyltransferase